MDDLNKYRCEFCNKILEIDQVHRCGTKPIHTLKKYIQDKEYKWNHPPTTDIT